MKIHLVNPFHMRYNSRMNKAAFTLSAWLRDNEVSQSVFAERIGISRATLSRIINGRQQPSVGVAISIENATDGHVDVKGWLIPAKITAEFAA